MKAFNDCAEAWDKANRGTRKTINNFLLLVQPGSVIADAGCGNGRNIEAIAEKAKLVYAFDSAPKMVALAKAHEGKKIKVFQASFSRIPLPNASCDAVFCINALHHLRTQALRERAVAEFERILKPGGLLFVSVWNRDQPRFDKVKKANARVPFSTPKGKVMRFYHFFTEDELLQLLEHAGFKAEAFYEKNGLPHERRGSDNLCAEAKR